MTELSKRQFLAVGGSAGLGALVGSIIIRPLGTNDPWGEDAAQPVGGLNNPKSICLVFLKFRDSSDPTGNPPLPSPIPVPPPAVAFDAHLAWFLSKEKNRDHKAFAIAQLAHFRQNAAWQPSPEPSPDRDSSDFADFNFGGTSVIYFYVDDQPDISFDPVNLVQLTKYGAEGKRKKMTKNKAFFGAKLHDAQNAELPGQVLYLENHFKKFKDWEWGGLRRHK